MDVKYESRDRIAQLGAIPQLDLSAGSKKGGHSETRLPVSLLGLLSLDVWSDCPQER